MTRIIAALRGHRPAIAHWRAALQCGLLQALTVRVDRLG
jgi:hypothetical protein